MYAHVQMYHNTAYITYDQYFELDKEYVSNTPYNNIME